MINIKTKYFFIVIILVLFLSDNLQAKIYKFNNLGEARKIYPTNPAKAHELVDEAIEHYLKKPNKEFPWLGYAYRDKAFYLEKENNLKLALEFQTKSCEEHKKDFKKVKINDRKGNLITCYYFLSAYLNDNNLLEESIDISTKAINLFEEFKSNNYYINEYVGSKSLSFEVVQRARTYKDLFRYK